MNYPQPSEHVKAAMNAAMSLNHWDAVIDMLENSAAVHCDLKAAQRVIKIAKAEMQRELKRMDAAVTKTNKG